MMIFLVHTIFPLQFVQYNIVLLILLPASYCSRTLARASDNKRRVLLLAHIPLEWSSVRPRHWIGGQQSIVVITQAGSPTCGSTPDWELENAPRKVNGLFYMALMLFPFLRHSLFPSAYILIGAIGLDYDLVQRSQSR